MADSTGVILPYEQDAIEGKPMPAGLSMPDQITFQALSILYARNREGHISRDRAVVEKKELLHTRKLYQFYEAMCQEWVTVIRQTEAARCAYNKDRTLENADALVRIIDGRGLTHKCDTEITDSVTDSPKSSNAPENPTASSHP